MDVGEPGSRRLMYIAGEVVGGDWTTSLFVDRVQVFGHRVKASFEFVQSSSGLWALSQSVPRMTSWVLMDVT